MVITRSREGNGYRKSYKLESFLVSSYKTLLCLKDGTGVRRNTGPHISTLLGAGASDGRSLHLSLVVHDNASVIFEINKSTLLSSPALSLTHHNDGVHLLAQLGLSLLASSHDKVTGRGSRKSVLSTLHTAHGDDHE